jgi:hypothetical protein
VSVTDEHERPGRVDGSGDAFGDRLPRLLEQAKAMAASLRLIPCDTFVCGARLGWQGASRTPSLTRLPSRRCTSP